MSGRLLRFFGDVGIYIEKDVGIVTVRIRDQNELYVVSLSYGSRRRWFNIPSTNCLSDSHTGEKTIARTCLSPHTVP